MKSFVLPVRVRIRGKQKGIGERLDESDVHVRKYGGETMLATIAFDVCHDVYCAAREAIDNKIPTLNAEASGKYLWRPDRMPRLAEYVCDFARAGERALGCTSMEGKSKTRQAEPGPTLPFRASRMAMFRVYYLGGAEYHAARRHLGISELTWADWAEEIRKRVGRELTRTGVFPPSKYFREISAKAS
jgi:hypothetical protein